MTSISNPSPICKDLVLNGPGPKICPTDELKKMETFQAITAFLFEGSDVRFGKFTPVEKTFTKSGETWRLFEAQNQTVDKGVLCNKTILLKSIVNQINALKPADRMFGSLSRPEGVEPVKIIVEEGYDAAHAAQLIAVRDWLNTCAAEASVEVKE